MKKIFLFTAIALLLCLRSVLAIDNTDKQARKMAREAFDIKIIGIDYDSLTGKWRLTSGYFLPADACSVLWNSKIAAVPDACSVIWNNKQDANNEDSNHVTVDNNSTDANLADINGLSVTVLAGRNYSVIAELFVVEGVGGSKYGIGGTAVNDINIFDYITTPVDSNSHTTIKGFLSVTTGGTVTIKFAQNTASGTSTVRKGSWMKVKKIN
jgi:hypothetical protein